MHIKMFWSTSNIRDNTNLFMCQPPNPRFLKDLVFSSYNEKNIGYGLIKVENCQKYLTDFGKIIKTRTFTSQESFMGREILL